MTNQILFKTKQDAMSYINENYPEVAAGSFITRPAFLMTMPSLSACLAICTICVAVLWKLKTAILRFWKSWDGWMTAPIPTGCS